MGKRRVDRRGNHRMTALGTKDLIALDGAAGRPVAIKSDLNLEFHSK